MILLLISFLSVVNSLTRFSCPCPCHLPLELLRCFLSTVSLHVFFSPPYLSLTQECFISQGVFVQLVQANSPAALAGLRFGDQVLQINGQNCAGWSVDKSHKALKAAAETRIELVVRDR